MRIYDKNGDVRESFSVKEAKNKGILPKNVAGDIRRRAGGETAHAKLKEELKSGSTKTLSVYPYKEKLSYAEKVEGYIIYDQNEEETEYVRIVKRSVLKILIPILLILALIGAGVVWYIALLNGPDLDKAAVAYEMPGGMVNTDPKELMMPYYDEVTVTSDDRSGHVVLSNPEGNRSYFRYVLTRTDTGEELYRSGLIEPGMAVSEWKINQDLKPGDYDAQLAIETYSLENHEHATNGGNMVITLHVE